MKVIIQSIHFKADKKLLNFVQQKVEKTETFIDTVINAEVFLKLENSQTGNNKVVEIKLNLPGNPIFAKEQNSTFEAATDVLVDKLITQVKKYKEKLQAKTA